jgi:hypothetical protein
MFYGVCHLSEVTLSSSHHWRFPTVVIAIETGHANSKRVMSINTIVQ